MIKIGNVELAVGFKDGKRIFEAFEDAARRLDAKQAIGDFKEILEPAVRAAAAAIADGREILPGILDVLEPAKSKLFGFVCDAISQKHGQEYLDDLLRRFGQSKVA